MKPFNKVLIAILVLTTITSLLVHIGSMAAFVTAPILFFSVMAAPLIAQYIGD